MATEEPQQPRSFQSVVDRIPDSKRADWFLRLREIQGDAGGEVELPPRFGLVREAVRSAGLPPGRYMVQVVRRDEGTGAARASLTKLKAHGPVRSIIEVLGDGSEPQAPTVSAAPRTVSRPSITTPADPAVAEVHRQAALANAQAARMRAEIERLKMQRELETAGGPSGSDVLGVLRAEIGQLRAAIQPRDQNPQLLAALIPLVQAIVQSMMASSDRREALMVEFLKAGRADKASASTELAALIPAIGSILELATGLGGGGGGGGEDKGLMSQVGEILAAFRGAREQQPPQGRIAPPVPRQPTPEEAMRIAVLRFLSSVQQYAIAESDPLAAADQLDHDFGLLPKEFRELVLNNGSVEAVIAGLVRWMPQGAYQELTALLTSRPVVKTWLADFCDALRGDVDEGEVEDTEDDPEDDAPPPQRRRPDQGVMPTVPFDAVTRNQRAVQSAAEHAARAGRTKFVPPPESLFGSDGTANQAPPAG